MGQVKQTRVHASRILSLVEEKVAIAKSAQKTATSRDGMSGGGKLVRFPDTSPFSKNVVIDENLSAPPIASTYLAIT
jgi:hypothetical protein